ncbi:MAG: BolA family protein [Myxococcota bacterium]|nr:BolA family protein [Myxococcota bacterium]
MGLKIIGAADDVVEKLTNAIQQTLPGAEVSVTAGGPGHFEVSVVSDAFEGRSMVQQHQLVYRAIAPLMAGDAPPVHAIDRLETRTP